MRLGIIGAGGIAQKMAEALANKPHGCECYAVASRSLEKAEAFAKQFYINKVYGSYEELVGDPAVDIVYIATPHSNHYPHARLALEPHAETLAIMRQMDALRKEWGVRYPMD